MFLFLACFLLLFNVVFLVLKKVAPYSEIMNSFKTVNGFWKAQAACLTLVLLFVFLHFSGEERAKWHISPDYVSNGVLYLGDESGSVEYESLVVEERNYETKLMLPIAALDADKVRLLFSHDGSAEENQFEISQPLNKKQPVTLWFPENGKWRMDIEIDGNVYSSIVLPVKEK